MIQNSLSSEQSDNLSSPLSQPSPLSSRATLSKQPQPVFDDRDPASSLLILAFPPNRDTLGGTAYLIVEKEGNILVDCPAWNEVNQQFLQEAGVRHLVITHRGGMGKVRKIQETLGCEVIVQEQEAYLLPNLTITSFHQTLALSSSSQVIWTPGHSPGASCLYYSKRGGVLFSGRHLLPDRQANPVPLRTAKTFHWTRQIRSVQKLLTHFSSDTLHFICPGASVGLLRGNRKIDHAYQKLAQFDQQSALKTPSLL